MQLELFEGKTEEAKMKNIIWNLYEECRKEWDANHAQGNRYSMALWTAMDFLKLPDEYIAQQFKDVKFQLEQMKIWLDKVKNYDPYSYSSLEKNLPQQPG